ncbi:MAG: AAA family ATPase [Deltaproteobacteria bacterium]|jgi:hypothetical protein|nr:AAA family ATPase [Deltaproteobacteria bacterium]
MTQEGLPRLPIGRKGFEKLRLDKAVYVDKTKYLPMVKEAGKYVFCARPRGFGKSLTVTALDAFWSGRTDLFQGLAAEKAMTSPDFMARPVIRLDMSGPAYSDSKTVLEERITGCLGVNAERHKVSLRGADSSDAFLRLIEDIHGASGKRVVILIDEYDAPVTSIIQRGRSEDNKRLLKQTWRVMQSFYKRIKIADEHIESVFVTGATKYSWIGESYPFHYLIDISLEPEFGAFMGFTHEELENDFEGVMAKTAQELGTSEKGLLRTIKARYDGFSFDGKTRLYNPFSVLSFLGARKFGNFWTESGSSDHVRKFMRDNCLTAEQFRGKVVDREFARDPGGIDLATPKGFLYQTGYLTLRYKSRGKYVLDYPNLEVRSSVSAMFLENLSHGAAWNDIRKYGRDLTRHLAGGDVDGMVGVFTRLLSSIIFHDHADANREPRDMTLDVGVPEAAGEGSPTEPSRETPEFLAEKLLRTLGERFYRSILHAGLWMAGASVTAEKGESMERSDLEAAYGRHPYVIGLKMTDDVGGADKAVKAGMVQMREKGCGRSRKEPILVSLAIGRRERNIVACLFKKDGQETAVEIKAAGKL